MRLWGRHRPFGFSGNAASSSVLSRRRSGGTVEQRLYDTNRGNDITARHAGRDRRRRASGQARIDHRDGEFGDLGSAAAERIICLDGTLASAPEVNRRGHDLLTGVGIGDIADEKSPSIRRVVKTIVGISLPCGRVDVSASGIAPRCLMTHNELLRSLCRETGLEWFSGWAASSCCHSASFLKAVCDEW